jgi:hypothetical protein
MEGISTEVLVRKCLGCKSKFQTYYFDKFYCTDGCRMRTNKGKIRKRNAHGEFIA